MEQSIIQLDRKLNEEFNKLKNYNEFIEFKNKYKDYIFIDYFIMEPDFDI